MGFQRAIEEALVGLEEAGLRRRPPSIEGSQGPMLVIDGRPVACFCSNNYLGLAADPRLAEAAAAAAKAEGVGSGASRLITGTMAAHGEAERELAGFVGMSDAVLFSTGYAANVGALQAVIGPEDAVFSDALNHASLIDGCRLSRARVFVYRHRDPDHLEGLLRAHRGAARRALIVTDSLFSMDGVAAPLRALDALAGSYDAGLMVDEAHALGVFGPSGAGLCAAEGVTPDLLVGTLGKSFGASGAFVAGSGTTIAFLRNRARSFVYSTAPGPPIVRAALAALPLVRQAHEARQRLLAHADHLRQALRGMGFQVPEGVGPIVPVLLGDNERTMRASRALLEDGVFVQGIRPPTVPEGTSRLRLTTMATHEPEHIDLAVRAFAALRRREAEGRP